MNTKPLVTTNYDDFLTKGAVIVLDPDDADALGVVEETALSEADAWESQGDDSEVDELQKVQGKHAVLGGVTDGR